MKRTELNWMMVPALLVVALGAMPALAQLIDPTRPPGAAVGGGDPGAPGGGPQLQSVMISGGERSAIIGGETVKLAPKEFVLLYWLARRRLVGHEPVRCDKTGNPDAAGEYLEACRQVFCEHGGEVERAEASLKNGMDSAWFSPAKTRLHAALVRALGQSGAAPYQIRASGKGKGDRFGLGLAAEQIHIQN